MLGFHETRSLKDPLKKLQIVTCNCFIDFIQMKVHAHFLPEIKYKNSKEF